jgi:hypothetical protein
VREIQSSFLRWSCTTSITPAQGQKQVDNRAAHWLGIARHSPFQILTISLAFQPNQSDQSSCAGLA